MSNTSPRAREIERQFKSMEKAATFDLTEQRANTKDAHVLAGVPREVIQEWDTVAGTRCLRIRPARAKGDAEIIFLHGGAYCLMSAMTHHRLAGHIANVTGTEVIVPDYSLAPERPYPTARNECQAIIVERREIGPKFQCVMGDSAGGGLALSSVCSLRDAGAQLPNLMVLMSPWLDLTLSGEAIITGCSLDPILTESNLRACVELYCTPSETELPGVSPLFAALHGLPPTLVQAASKDLVRDDAIRLSQLWPDDGLSLRTYDDMLHSFQMFAGDMPEADEALQDAADFVQTILRQ